jgi:hypothetical protein
MGKVKKRSSIRNFSEITQPIFLHLPLEIARDLMNEAYRCKGRTVSNILVERLQNGYYIGTGPNPKKEIEIALINLDKNISSNQKQFGDLNLRDVIERTSNPLSEKTDNRIR